MILIWVGFISGLISLICFTSYFGYVSEELNKAYKPPEGSYVEEARIENGKVIDGLQDIKNVYNQPLQTKYLVLVNQADYPKDPEARKDVDAINNQRDMRQKEREDQNLFLELINRDHTEWSSDKKSWHLLYPDGRDNFRGYDKIYLRTVRIKDGEPITDKKIQTVALNKTDITKLSKVYSKNMSMK